MEALRLATHNSIHDITYKERGCNYMDYKQLPKDTAMHDIGLTEEEADFAVDMYYNEPTSSYCDDCGAYVDDLDSPINPCDNCYLLFNI